MMDFCGRRHERGSNWTDPEIVELLQLWSDEAVQVELETSLRNQRVFDRIAHALRAKGIQRSGDQCREKIKKMKLEYRRIKDNHKLRSWKFYDVMDRVLANRPAITYSSLGGAVIAQQVFHHAGAPEAYLQAGAFGPTSSGGFLFGQPPRPGEPPDIKCEDVDERMLSSGAAPPEMYYGSGDDQDAEDKLCPAESSANARMSPSAFSDLHLPGSATASCHPAGGPSSQDTSDQPAGEPPTSGRQRKRRRGGKTWRGHGGRGPGGQQSLDEALASLLSWQQDLEETRLQRELQAEELREQRQDRRAEQDRQHELRLFSMLTGAMLAVRHGAPAATPRDPPAPPGADPSTPQTSSSEPASGGPAGQDASARDSKDNTPGRSAYLSNRGNRIRQHRGVLQEAFLHYAADKHHDTHNPNGIINMATSENKLCFDLLQRRWTRPDMLHADESLMQYSDWRGRSFLREEVAKFLTHYCGSSRPLHADNVVVMNGCSSLFSCIAAVICDPKDAVLIPTPFYGVITEDLGLYSEVQLFHVPLECEGDGTESRPFRLTVGKLELGLRRARREGLNVRAVILMNPHNPLAEVYAPDDMSAFLEFAKRNELHAIVDEVYMLTVFEESVTFHSVLGLDRLPDPQRTHVMWGMSKDFAMSGMRIGTLYTENRELVEALTQLGSFHGLPGTTQHQVAQLLGDRAWISEEFLPVTRRRLKAAHSLATAELLRLGVPCLSSAATLYLWADFRRYLREPSPEEELCLWRRFLKHKVVLSCGQAFSCSTPGWFRIVFADQHHRLELGLKRIKAALKEAEVQRAGSEGGFTSAMEDGAQSDNAALVDATPAPSGDSSAGLKASPVPDTDSVDAEGLVSPGGRAPRPADDLASLVGTLRRQIRSSDWLEKNTPELAAGEDPGILDVFKVLLQRAGK